jgi:hypothetical protein
MYSISVYNTVTFFKYVLFTFTVLDLKVLSSEMDLTESKLIR